MSVKNVKKVYLRHTEVEMKDILEIILDGICGDSCSTESEEGFDIYRYSGEEGSFVIKTIEDNGLEVESETSSLTSDILLNIVDIYGGYIEYTDDTSEDYERDLSNRLRLASCYCEKNDQEIEVAVDNKFSNILCTLRLINFADYHEHSKSYGCSGYFEVKSGYDVGSVEGFTSGEVEQILDFLKHEELYVNCSECV